MKQTKTKAGFTLVELLVVIGIIAALAGFAISNLGNADKAVQLTSMKQDVASAITQVHIAKANGRDITAINLADKVDSGVEEAVAKSYTQMGDDSAAIVKVQISPNNKITFGKKACTADEGGGNGFTLEVTSSANAAKKVTFDSCADVAPVVGNTAT